MTPDQAVAEARTGELRPVYLVVGEESYLAASVVTALRKAALEGAVPGLNEDQLNAGERGVDDALAAARTLPMMGKRRLVVVQRLERWEPKQQSEDAARSGKDPFERLLEYAKNPLPTTTLLLVGGAVDKRRKLVTTARSEGWLVSCEALGRHELPGFVDRAARSLGAKLEPGVADLVAELSGPELGPVADAVERLSLYANGQPITEEMVAECVVRLRPASVWELVSAVGRRDVATALATLDSVFDPNESLRLVGLLAWSARQLVRFEAAQRAGLSLNEAAQQAGAPPFKGRELAQQIKGVSRRTLEGWLLILTDMDRSLKGGSKLPAKSVLEHGILEMCRDTSAMRPPGP